MSKSPTKTILSIQSHVAYGYVGNRAAVFPLQRMGYDVIAINTVQFSNHTGYGEWRGDVFSPDHIQDILEGIDKRGVKIDALLTGYLGDAAIGQTILNAIDHFNIPLWLCDPVMGDVGRGFFVHKDIPDFFKEKAARRAAIMKPNQFELNALTGMTIATSGPNATFSGGTITFIGPDVPATLSPGATTSSASGAFFGGDTNGPSGVSSGPTEVGGVFTVIGSDNINNIFGIFAGGRTNETP
jgi:pyridoxine kinase